MNNGTSFCAPMTSNSYTCNIFYDNSGNKYYTCNYAVYTNPYYDSSVGLYEDFVNSLSDYSYNKHTEGEIDFAKKFFSNYLSDDELVTEQKSGRFWAVSTALGDPFINILLDDDTVLTVCYDITSDKYKDKIEDRSTAVMLENIRYKKYGR